MWTQDGRQKDSDILSGIDSWKGKNNKKSDARKVEESIILCRVSWELSWLSILMPLLFTWGLFFFPMHNLSFDLLNGDKRDSGTSSIQGANKSSKWESGGGGDERSRWSELRRDETKCWTEKKERWGGGCPYSPLAVKRLKEPKITSSDYIRPHPLEHWLEWRGPLTLSMQHFPWSWRIWKRRMGMRDERKRRNDGR